MPPVTSAPSHRKTWLRAASLLLWLGLLAWLVRYEAFPERFTQRIDGYSKLVDKDMLVVDSWMKLMLNDVPIGYSYTSMDAEESNPSRYYQISTRMQMKVKILGELHDLGVDLTVYLDITQKLQEFDFSFSSRQYSLKIEGKRTRGALFQCSIRTPGGRQDSVVDIPDDVILHSPMTEMALARLRPGQQVSLKVMDPTTLSASTMIVKALRRESLTYGSATNECVVIASDYQGANILSWISDHGEVLRQETSFGWSLEKCTPDEAASALRSAGAAGDLLAGAAVKCDGIIRAPRTTPQLILQLTGVPFTETELQSSRQSLRQTGTNEFALTLHPATFPTLPPTGAIPATVTVHLQPSSTIQSEHPDILAAMTRVVRNSDTPEAKARAIYEWVYKNVTKETTLSLPSALDVLKTMKGDCNEHTALFVALARAAGLPAKTVVGIAYHQGAFYYHAWPAVFVGDWVEMDPTWGQPTVDASHIAMAEGELAGQLRIMKAVGKLRIRVLSEAAGEIPKAMHKEIDHD